MAFYKAYGDKYINPALENTVEYGVEKLAGVFIDGYNDKVNTSIDDHIYNSYPDMDQGTKDRLKEA